MAEQAVRNVADPEQVKASAKKQKNREAQEDMDLRAILGTDTGRRAMYRIIAETGHQSRSYGPTDAIQFQQGRRDVGLRIIEQIVQLDPAIWIQMQQEALEVKEKK